MPNVNDLDMGYVLRLEPKLAVDYLKSKGYNITWNWQEQLEEAHVRAFTVAKATRAEILETLHQATIEAIEKGMSEREFINNLEPTLQAMGWWGKQVVVDSRGNAEQVELGSPRRLRTILRTNKITAYHVGRYASQMENVDEQPYWQYVAIRDSRTRASHLALDGKVFRYDDPIWDTFYPPNDWGCRCRVRALSEFKVNKQGLRIEDSTGRIKTDWALAGVDKSSGEETHAKISVFTTDKGTIRTGAGWNYNVGKAAIGSDIAVIRKLQQIQNRELRQQTIQAINNSEVRHKAFANWVKAMLSKAKHNNMYIGVGIIATDIAEQVTTLSEGAKVSEQLIVMTERNFTHSNSPKHREKGVALSEEEFASLPQIIAQPLVVVWDKKHNNLIYVNQDKSIKAVVELSPRKQKVKFEPPEKLDTVLNTYKLDYADFVGKVKQGDYVIVKGSL
jgi:Mu-like prophage fluMu F protein